MLPPSNLQQWHWDKCLIFFMFYIYIYLSVCHFVKSSVCQTFAHCFVLSTLKNVHFEPLVCLICFPFNRNKFYVIMLIKLSANVTHLLCFIDDSRSWKLPCVANHWSNCTWSFKTGGSNNRISSTWLSPFVSSEETKGGYKKEFHLIFVPRKSLLCEKKLKVFLVFGFLFCLPQSSFQDSVWSWVILITGLMCIHVHKHQFSWVYMECRFLGYFFLFCIPP